jgi:microcystin-dependent protein
MGGTDAALISVFDTTIIGKTGGVDEVTLTAGQLPAHTHTTAVPGTTAASAAIGVDVATPTATAPVESSSIGSGAPVSIIQPSIILPFIIKL